MAPPDKLSIIVFSGDYGRVHYAFTMASAAVAANKKVTLFFTMEGTRALLRPGASGAPDWSAAEADYAAKGVATIAEMLDACIELDAKFMVCEMGLRATGIASEDLRDDVKLTEGGAVSFIDDASRHGTMLFI